MRILLASHEMLIVFAICLGLIFVAGAILGLINGQKTKKRVEEFADSLVNPPAKDLPDAADAKTETDEEAEADGETEEDEEFPDPVFEEYAVTVKQLQCGVGLDQKSRYAFLATFETEEGKEMVFNVGQTLYLSLTEGQTGYLATVNGNFFGFTTEEEAAEAEGAEEGTLSEGAEGSDAEACCPSAPEADDVMGE